MGIAAGTYLGSVRNLEDLRCRCVMDQDTQCWHLKTARGRAMPRGRESFPVNVYQRGKIPATRVAWEFGRGKAPAAGSVVWRACKSYDCVNPKHLRNGSRQDFVAWQTKKGVQRSILHRLKTQAIVRARPNVKLTEELAQWVRESPQSAANAAHALAVPKSKVIAIRAGKAWRPMLLGASAFMGMAA